VLVWVAGKPQSSSDEATLLYGGDACGALLGSSLGPGESCLINIVVSAPKGHWTGRWCIGYFDCATLRGFGD
jgi:hypothetical protein